MNLIYSLSFILFFSNNILPNDNPSDNVEIELFYQNQALHQNDTLKTLAPTNILSIKVKDENNTFQKVVWQISLNRGSQLKLARRGQGFDIDIRDFVSTATKADKIMLEIIQLENLDKPKTFKSLPKKFNLYLK